MELFGYEYTDDKLKGLREETVYETKVISVSAEVRNEDVHREGADGTEKTYAALNLTGSALMNAGYWMDRLSGDYDPSAG